MPDYSDNLITSTYYYVNKNRFGYFIIDCETHNTIMSRIDTLEQAEFAVNVAYEATESYRQDLSLKDRQLEHNEQIINELELKLEQTQKWLDEFQGVAAQTYIDYKILEQSQNIPGETETVIDTNDGERKPHEIEWGVRVANNELDYYKHFNKGGYITINGDDWLHIDSIITANKLVEMLRRISSDHNVMKLLDELQSTRNALERAYYKLNKSETAISNLQSTLSQITSRYNAIYSANTKLNNLLSDIKSDLVGLAITANNMYFDMKRTGIYNDLTNKISELSDRISNHYSK